MKIISYNLNGLRAATKLGVLDWLKEENADIVCLQEVRASKNICEELLKCFKDYFITYNCGIIKGYAGTITLSKSEPKSVVFGFDEEDDIEGRLITTIFDEYTVVNSYIPNGSKRLEYKKHFIEQLTNHINNYKNVFLCCDANIAHNEIDVNKPKETSKKSGFLMEERILMDKLINDNLIDSFRAVNSDSVQYTWRSYKSRKEKGNFGWKFRFDYIICNKKLINKIRKCYSLDLEFSDHLPVILEVM